MLPYRGRLVTPTKPLKPGRIVRSGHHRLGVLWRLLSPVIGPTSFAVAVLFTVAACERGPADQIGQQLYLVSSAPISVGLPQHLCVAVEPTNSKGVWWWEPGATGCATRSTGPSVFAAQDASVTSVSSNRIEIRFRVPLHRETTTQQGAVDIMMILEGNQLTVPATQARVAVEHRRALDIPERL